MNTVSFQKVLYGVARRMGLDPLRNLPQNVADTLAGYVDEHARHGWNAYPWPEICPTEKRVYRPQWDAATVYAYGQEVWDEGQQAYYMSLENDNQGNPVTATAANDTGLFIEIDIPGEPTADDANGFWTRISTLERVILFDQPGKTPIGTVFEVWRDDPTRVRRPRPVDFWISAAGVQLDSTAPDVVWINFRTRPPEFTATPWKASKIYPQETVIYFADSGECYRALSITAAGESPKTSPEKWEKQSLLAALAPYVELAAYSDFLMEDGQTDKAAILSGKADGRLADAMDIINEQQRQTAQFSVRSR